MSRVRYLDSYLTLIFYSDWLPQYMLNANSLFGFLSVFGTGEMQKVKQASKMPVH